jgi:hypothetical protein
MAAGAGQQDVTTLIPRLRRAIGVDLSTDLTDDQVKDAAADAIADVIFYTGGLFGHQLIALDYDSTYNAPSHWAVDPTLAPEEETVIVAQAAINFYFHHFRSLKPSETMSNEGQSWEYQLSASLIREQFKQLVEARDRALAVVERQHPVPTVFASFLEARDYQTARALEPWVDPMPIVPQGQLGGLEAAERFGP